MWTAGSRACAQSIDRLIVDRLVHNGVHNAVHNAVHNVVHNLCITLALFLTYENPDLGFGGKSEQLGPALHDPSPLLKHKRLPLAENVWSKGSSDTNRSLGASQPISNGILMLIRGNHIVISVLLSEIELESSGAAWIISIFFRLISKTQSFTVQHLFISIPMACACLLRKTANTRPRPETARTPSRPRPGGSFIRTSVPHSTVAHRILRTDSSSHVTGTSVGVASKVRPSPHLPPLSKSGLPSHPPSSATN